MDSYQFKTWLSFLLLAVVIIVIFQVVTQSAAIFAWVGVLIHTIAPFAWGFMIGYVLNIPREGLERLLMRFEQHIPFVAKRVRGFSVLLTYILFVAIVAVLSALVIPQIYASIMDFLVLLPELINEILGMAEGFLNDLDQNDDLPFINGLSAAVYGFNAEDILNIFDFDNMMDNVWTAINTLGSFVGSLFRAALALISSVYFMLEGERVKAFVARILKAVSSYKFYTAFVKYGRDINVYFKRYIFCQVLDAIILGTIMTAALSVMGIDYAFALGPMLGFANLIPYFGSIVGTAAAIVVIMLTEGAQMGLIAGTVMLVIQQVDANFIFPRLLGGSMKIPPLLVIIGITVGGAYYGILGMIVAIPIATVMKSIIEDVLRNIELKKGIARGEIDRRQGDRRVKGE